MILLLKIPSYSYMLEQVHFFPMVTNGGRKLELGKLAMLDKVRSRQLYTYPTLLG